MPRNQIYRNVVVATIEVNNGKVKRILKSINGVNKIEVKYLIKIILAYSAIKIRAKDPLLYSVLNPETSSDSPSAKSKGLRLVSARVVVNHIDILKGKNKNIKTFRFK